MEIPMNFNLHQVLFVQVGLSILASGSVSPSYNLPIHLYGLYNLDNEVHHFPGASDGLRQYSILLVVSFGLDLIWIYNWSSSISSLPFVLILVGLIIKPISWMICLSKLNQTYGTTGLTEVFLQPSSTTAAASMPLPNGSYHQASSNLSRGFQRDSNHGSKFRSDQNRIINTTKPGPSSISHQSQSSQLINPSQAYHEFDLDSDAQNLSDDDLKFAQQELQNRIAQKQQQQQSPLLPLKQDGQESLGGLGGSGKSLGQTVGLGEPLKSEPPV
ncbi:uncharacterized protein MELLADRAFT_72660 [Melampsora larici-populina 98AG31]|uniref:Uncharacterized protein n=1 Tax=Melampsora larici-populina (strain 98AG31 / pathotype 3-4-7) TaxID=747676 RepID=F4RX97_MELLP|nr:uncharacterized protein MELLADRAFT_72660 [Melampsora larici-populina 98AG31]EGG03024.1 hypothetical protein MELLADRAFT_72660 [Melampsora larici-populina 98AG31]